ncbi:MAG TPA: S8 family peptidase, partial [Planctomycetota bacterium]|nr:S8 family peptidase [Planctomycetota bacterium]
MQSLEKAEKESELRRKDAAAKGLTVLGAPTGLYVRVEGAPDFPLELKSLQVPSQNIEIMSVDPLVKGKTPERAVILVPHGSVGHFLKRFEAYRTKETKAGNPRHQKLVDSIGALELATLRALWTDVTNLYPATDDQEIWWELWLRAHDGKEIERLTAYAQKAGLRLGERRLTFPDRIVILAYGSPRVLSASIDVLDDLAEVRRAKELGLGFFRMGPIEVAEWVTELAGRIEPAPPEAGAVTVLDTGANRGHPLLEPSLAEVDTHACDPAWGKHDHDGHGTEMSGIALLGDLRAPLLAAGPVRLTHCLESVKILPPPEQAETPPDLYGARTAEAVSRVEIQAPDRRRAFALAVTSDSRDRGQPTSWSAAVDALAAGRSFDTTTQGL